MGHSFHSQDKSLLNIYMGWTYFLIIVKKNPHIHENNLSYLILQKENNLH